MRPSTESREMHMFREIDTTWTCMKVNLPTILTTALLTIMKVYIRNPTKASTVFKEMPTLLAIDTAWRCMKVNLPMILTTAE